MFRDFFRTMINRFRSPHSPAAGQGTHGIIRRPDIYIAQTDGPKGRGVFANRNFDMGEIVECCPVLIIEEPVCELPEQLKTIVFEWSVLAGADTACAIALGSGSLYKHDISSNMRYEMKAEQSVLVFTTVRPVRKDEELTVNFGAIGGGPMWDYREWIRKPGQI